MHLKTGVFKPGEVNDKHFQILCSRIISLYDGAADYVAKCILYQQMGVAEGNELYESKNS